MRAPMSVQLISAPSSSTRKNARSPTTPPTDTSMESGWCSPRPLTGVIDSSDTDSCVPCSTPCSCRRPRERSRAGPPILADADRSRCGSVLVDLARERVALRQPDAVARRVAEARVDAVRHLGRLLGELDATRRQLLVRLHRVVGGEEDRAAEPLGGELGDLRAG